MAPTELSDDVTNEEESDEFREMVDDGRDTEQCGTSSEILEMPEEESKDETHTESHEPENEEHGTELDRSEHLEYGDPLGQSSSLTWLAAGNVRAWFHGHRIRRNLIHVMLGVRDHVPPGFILQRNVNPRRILTAKLTPVNLSTIGRLILTFQIPDLLMDCVHDLVLDLGQWNGLDGCVDFLEPELGGDEESEAHEHGEDCVAGHVVPVHQMFRSARMIWKDVGMIESDSDEEHGDGPAERSVHPLLSIVLHVVLQVSEGGSVGHRDRRCAQELPEDLKDQQDQEDGANILDGKFS